MFCVCQILFRCLKLVKALGEYMDITRSHGLRLPTKRPLDLLAPLLSCKPVKPAGIPWKHQKVSWLSTLCWSAGRFGNPLLLGNWIDESDNRKLSLVASTAQAHSVDFCTKIGPFRLVDHEEAKALK